MVCFIEPLHKPEDNIETEEPQNMAGEIDNEDVEEIDLPNPEDIDGGEAGDQPTLF